MAYTTAGVVAGLIGRLFGGGFSTTTAPTALQVTDMITGISAEIDVHLDANGYTTPITTPTDAVAFLSQLCAYGVAALVLRSFAPETIGAGANGSPTEPAFAFYEGLYQTALNQIDSGVITLQGNTPAFAQSYLTENPDNTGDDGADGVIGGQWGAGQQPFVSMQKKF